MAQETRPRPPSSATKRPMPTSATSGRLAAGTATEEWDESFGATPNLVVIDGGKGQLAAGLRALQVFRDRGVIVISLAKRIEEVFIPFLGAATTHGCPSTRIRRRRS